MSWLKNAAFLGMTLITLHAFHHRQQNVTASMDAKLFTSQVPISYYLLCTSLGLLLMQLTVRKILLHV
jgi:hypothetical protein